MAHSASELEQSRFIRVLLLGPAKVGKSAMAVGSSPKPVRVFLCESDSALQSVRKLVGDDFTFERTRTHKAMLEAIYSARRDIKNGEIKTLIVDPLSTMAQKLEEHCLRVTKTGAGAENPMKAYPMYRRILQQIREQLLDLKCHLVVITHYIEVGGSEIDGTPQTGEGIVPLLAGKARAEFAAAFPDVVWMDYQNRRRVLVTGPQGAWGPGCRSLKDTKILPADITSGKKRVGIRALIRAFERER